MLSNLNFQRLILWCCSSIAYFFTSIFHKKSLSHSGFTFDAHCTIFIDWHSNKIFKNRIFSINHFSNFCVCWYIWYVLSKHNKLNDFNKSFGDILTYGRPNIIAVNKINKSGISKVWLRWSSTFPDIRTLFLFFYEHQNADRLKRDWRKWVIASRFNFSI